MLAILNWMGPFWVGLTFLIGILAIPLSIFFFFLHIKKQKIKNAAAEAVPVPEKVGVEAEVDGELVYRFDSCNLLLQHKAGQWFAAVQMGDHQSALPVPPNANVGQVFWDAINHLRIPRQQSVFA